MIVIRQQCLDIKVLLSQENIIYNNKTKVEPK